MATISSFLPAPNLKLPSHQLLPPHSHDGSTMPAPALHTCWINALSLYHPYASQTSESTKAHKNLLNHIISDTVASDQATLSLADLRDVAQAPAAALLYLNLGLIRAWLGENWNAFRNFELALALDDGESPALSAVVNFLLGCVQFLLRHWRGSRKSFERCLLHFRKASMGRDRGEVELLVAAPWVGTSGRGVRSDDDAQRAVEKDRAMERRYKYRVYWPKNNTTTTPPKTNKEYHEWSLERSVVEANLAAAKARLERKNAGFERDGDERPDTEISGIPGGVLFWPLDSPPTPVSASTPNKQHPAPSEQTSPPPPPAPTWNEETQTFDPYIPPQRPAASLWLDVETAPLPPHHEDEDAAHAHGVDLGILSDYEAEDPQDADFLDYYYSGSSAPPPPPVPLPLPTRSSSLRAGKESGAGKRGGANDKKRQTTPTHETARQRLERQTEAKRASKVLARGEALAALEGRRASSTSNSHNNGGIVGLWRRSVASLKASRGSRDMLPVEEEDLSGLGLGADGMAMWKEESVFEEDVDVEEEDERLPWEKSAGDNGARLPIGGEVMGPFKEVDLEMKEKEDWEGDFDTTGLGPGRTLLPLTYVAPVA